MIRALTLDLDDTLWPVTPVILAAERSLHDWLATHCPEVTSAHSIESMRSLRDAVYDEHPHLHHDFTSLRKISLRRALQPHGYADAHVEQAFEVFFAARNQVQLFDDAEIALGRLSARLPIASLSNGNADLQRIGLNQHFQHQVTARQFGQAKPHPDIFLHACAQLGHAPAQVAHVGDDPLLDVVGAKQAGLFAVWLNRGDAQWTESLLPDLIVRDLHELADWVDSQ